VSRTPINPVITVGDLEDVLRQVPRSTKLAITRDGARTPIFSIQSTIEQNGSSRYFTINLNPEKPKS
jgi:hypothetical protein